MEKTKEKRPDYLVLINGDNRLPDSFEDTVELIYAENFLGKHKIEKNTYEAFLRLQEDLLRNDGIQTELLGVCRTIEQQEEIFTRYINEHGYEYANKYAAKPGHSEHHTGLAIDVGIVIDGKLYRAIEDLLMLDDLFHIIHKKLALYGFILRYPKGKEAITKIGYEPWHFRYIHSPEIAREIADRQICFEEYCQKC